MERAHTNTHSTTRPLIGRMLSPPSSELSDELTEKNGSGRFSAANKDHRAPENDDDTHDHWTKPVRHPAATTQRSERAVEHRETDHEIEQSERTRWRGNMKND